MRTLLLVLALAATAAPVGHAQVLPAFGEDRAGTAGFQFLKIPVDARGAALGETVAATAADASALFWNPALAAQAGRTEIGAARTAYFAGVSMNYAAGFTRVGPVTLGLSLQSLDSGEMAVTDEFSGPEGTGETFRLVDVAAGVSVSQALTDLFSYGVTAKVVRESVADLSATTALLDLGIFYRIGQTGVDLGVAIRNFGPDGRPSGSLVRPTLDGDTTETSFESIPPPTTFLLGASYHVLRANPQHALTVSAQLTRPNDNAEQFHAGAEYVFRNLLSLRAGYRVGVEEASTPSFGAGLLVPGLGPQLRVDYAFNRLDRLGSVHRVGLNLRLD
ncbi:MAG TPA: PorV/PorQ family protein [Rubricoccaceae bacterium]|nr:PorV/PorQ family protein [Rubricoccaceae bacterium]